MEQWSFIADMNYSGSITISDVWLWVKWIYFYPGDLLLYLIMNRTPHLASFFEISIDNYGGKLSGMMSVIAWIVLLTILKEIYKESLTLMSRIRIEGNKFLHYFIKNEWDIKDILYWFIALYISVNILPFLASTLLAIIIISRCLYIKHYINNGGNIKNIYSALLEELFNAKNASFLLRVLLTLMFLFLIF